MYGFALAFNKALSAAVLICQQDIGIAPIKPRNQAGAARHTNLNVIGKAQPFAAAQPRKAKQHRSLDLERRCCHPRNAFRGSYERFSAAEPPDLIDELCKLRELDQGRSFPQVRWIPRDILYIFPTQPCVTPPVPICLHKCRLYLRRNLAHGKGAAHLIHAHD